MRSIKYLSFTIVLLKAISTQAGEYKNIVVVENPETKIEGEYITEIKFKENGFTRNCSYPEVIYSLLERAEEHGANLMQIIRHKKPDGWSSCHRITVALYKVADTKMYEQLVYWSKDRKLEWDDFKKKPNDNAVMDAESTCSLSFTTNTITLLNKIKYYVHTGFVPAESWVSSTGKESAELLNHEQRHFDLWEIYARMLYKELTNNKKYNFSIAHVNELFRSIHFDCVNRSNIYDSETDHGRNAEEQLRWNKIIDAELLELADYADHY